MRVKCSRVSDHPQAKSRQAALKKGWYQDRNGQWVCPKCQRELNEIAVNIEIQQPQEQNSKDAKKRNQKSRLPTAVLEGDQVAQFDCPRD